MKILFPTDGSAHAMRALKSLLDRETWFRDGIELTVINVHPAVPYRGAAAWAGKEAIARYYSDESDEVLKPSIAELARRGIAHKVEKRVGEPGETIVTFARDGGFDLIAMGTQGHTALATLVVGSVSAQVIAQSNVPVLLLR